MSIRRACLSVVAVLLIAQSMSLAQGINPPPIFNVRGLPDTYDGQLNMSSYQYQAPGNYGWYTGEWYWDLTYLSGNYYWTKFPTLYYQDKLDSPSAVLPVKDLPLYDLPDGLGPYGDWSLTLPTYTAHLEPIARLDRIKELPLECSPKAYPVSAAARYAVNLGGSAAPQGFSGALFYITAFYDSTLFKVELIGQQYNGYSSYSPGSVVLGPGTPRFVIGSAAASPSGTKRFTNITATPRYVKVSLQPGRSPRDAGQQSVQIKVDTIRWTGDTADFWSNVGDAFQYIRNGGATVQVFSLELPPNWCEDAPGLSPDDALPITTLSQEQRQAAEFDGIGAKLVNEISAELPVLKVGHARFRAGRTLEESLGNDAYWHNYTGGPFVRIDLLGAWCAVDDLPGWSFEESSPYLIVKDNNEGLDYYYENLSGGDLAGAPLKLRYVKRGTTTVRTYNYTGAVLDSQVASDHSITYAYATQGADTVLTVTGDAGEDGTRTITMRFDSATGYAREATWSSGGPARKYVYIIEPTNRARDGRIDKILDAADKVLLDFEYDESGRLTRTSRGSAGDGTYQLLNEHVYTPVKSGQKVIGTEMVTKGYVDGTSYQPIWRKLDEFNRVVEVKMYAARQSGAFNSAAASYLTQTVYRPNISLGISGATYTIEKRLPGEQVAEYSVFDTSFNVIRTFLGPVSLSTYSGATAKNEKRYTYEMKGGIWQRTSEIDVARSNATTVFTYDPNTGFPTGRMMPTISAANSASGVAIPGQVETKVYDPDTRKRVDTEARKDGQNGTVTVTNTYDDYDNLETRLEVGSDSSRQTTNKHNAFGQVYETVDAEGFVTKREFASGSGLLDKEYTYKTGSTGQVLRETQYVYYLSGADQGRLQKIRIADHEGPFTQGSPAGWQETEFGYDAYGRVVQKTVTHTAKTESHTWWYAYDHQDRITQISYPDGMWIRTLRDGRGAVVNEYVGYGGDYAAGTGGTTVLTNTYSYSPTTGNLASRLNQTAADLPDQTTYGYDTYNRRTSTTDIDDGTAGYDIVTTYGYNAGLDVIYEHVREGAEGPIRQYIERAYDELGRVWKETIREDPAAADATKDRITYTTYDVTGNERQVRVKDSTYGDAVTTRTFTCFDYPDTETRALTATTNAVTDYTTDLRGNITVILDPAGNQTEHDYDALGERTESRFYEDSGDDKALRLKTVTVYTSRQQRARQTQYDGQGTALDQQRWAYDLLGFQTRWARMADPAASGAISTTVDRVTDSTSDGVGRRLTTTTYDAGIARTTTSGYDPIGRPSTITHPVAGNSETFTPYTNSTRIELHTVTDQIGSRATQTKFDAFGRLCEQIEQALAGAAEVKTKFAHDGAGRRVKVTRVVPEMTPSDVVTWNEYDGIGQLAEVTEDSGGASQRVVSFTYTQKGDLRTVTANDGEADQVTTYSYNLAGTRTREQYPNGAGTDYGFDSAGRVETRTTADGFVTYYVYNWRGQVREKRFADASGTILESFGYDPLGRMTEAAGLGHTIYRTSFLYGDGQDGPAFVDEPVTTTQTVAGNNVQVHCDYNTAGVRCEMRYPGDNSRLTYHRDGFDQVTGIDRDGVRLVNYTYAGRKVVSRQVRVRGSGPEQWVEVAWDRPDQLRRPKQVTNRWRTGSTGGVGGTTSDFVRFDNVFDSASNLDRQTVTGSPIRSGMLDHGYDRLMRLERTDYPDATYESWGLDAFSNWTSYRPRSGVTLTFSDNILDQYTSITGQAVAPVYDAKGNLVLDDRGYGFTYDFENRLTRVYTDTDRDGTWDLGEPVHAEYVVDALGHRVEVTTGTSRAARIYDRDDLLAEFPLPAELPDWSPVRTFVNGTAAPDEKILMGQRGGPEFYFLQDPLGSIVGLVNERGGRVASYAYDGYGTPIATGPDCDTDADGDVDLKDFLRFQAHFGATGPAAAGYDFTGDGIVDLADYQRLAACLTGPLGVTSPFGFTGQGLDRLASGQLVLYDYKARVYDPRLGRFLQRDPSGPADSYNLYEYVRSRPTVATDPSGRMGISISMSTGIQANLVAMAMVGVFAAHQAGSALQSALADYRFSLELRVSGLEMLMGGRAVVAETLLAFGELAFFSKGRKEALEHAESLVPAIEEHIRKLLEIGAATGGPPDPKFERNWRHWVKELKGWLDDIERDLWRMKGKTADEWTKKIAEWRRFIDDATGGGGLGT